MLRSGRTTPVACSGGVAAAGASADSATFGTVPFACLELPVRHHAREHRAGPRGSVVTVPWLVNVAVIFPMALVTPSNRMWPLAKLAFHSFGIPRIDRPALYVRDVPVVVGPNCAVALMPPVTSLASQLIVEATESKVRVISSGMLSMTRLITSPLRRSTVAPTWVIGRSESSWICPSPMCDDFGGNLLAEGVHVRLGVITSDLERRGAELDLHGQLVVTCRP